MESTQSTAPFSDEDHLENVANAARLRQRETPVHALHLEKPSYVNGNVRIIIKPWEPKAFQDGPDGKRCVPGEWATLRPESQEGDTDDSVTCLLVPQTREDIKCEVNTDQVSFHLYYDSTTDSAILMNISRTKPFICRRIVADEPESEKVIDPLGTENLSPGSLNRVL
jgi:hypothetical protein